MNSTLADTRSLLRGVHHFIGVSAPTDGWLEWKTSLWPNGCWADALAWLPCLSASLEKHLVITHFKKMEPPSCTLELIVPKTDFYLFLIIKKAKTNTEAIWGETSVGAALSSPGRDVKRGQSCGDKKPNVSHNKTKQTNWIRHLNNPRSKVSPN